MDVAMPSLAHVLIHLRPIPVSQSCMGGASCLIYHDPYLAPILACACAQYSHLFKYVKFCQFYIPWTSVILINKEGYGR